MMTDTIGGGNFSPDPEPQYDWQRPGGTFEFGDVIGRAFDMMRRNFMPFAVTAIVLIGIPAILTLLFAAGAYAGTESGGAFGVLGAASGVGAVLGVIGLLVSMIILPAAIIYASLQGWAGNPISMRASLRLMLSRFWALLGMGILVGLGTALGFVFLIIPGIILLAGWYVVTPALLMERKGVMDSISRSWELTRGYKWHMLGVVIIGLIIQTLVALLFNVPTFLTAASADGAGFIISQLISTIGDAIGQLINALFIASAYYELRRVKEGVGIAAVADIFD